MVKATDVSVALMLSGTSVLKIRRAASVRLLSSSFSRDAERTAESAADCRFVVILETLLWLSMPAPAIVSGTSMIAKRTAKFASSSAIQR